MKEVGKGVIHALQLHSNSSWEEIITLTIPRPLEWEVETLEDKTSKHPFKPGQTAGGVTVVQVV